MTNRTEDAQLRQALRRLYGHGNGRWPRDFSDFKTSPADRRMGSKLSRGFVGG